MFRTGCCPAGTLLPSEQQGLPALPAWDLHDVTRCHGLGFGGWTAAQVVVPWVGSSHSHSAWGTALWEAPQGSAESLGLGL